MEELNRKIETEKCSEEDEQFEKEFEKERSARNVLTLIMLLTSVFIIVYRMIDSRLVVGAACVYLNTAAYLLSAAAGIVYVIFFFALIGKLTVFRGVYILWLIVAVLLGVSSSIFVVDYIKDMAGGTKTQQLEIYYAGRNSIAFTDENGESVWLDITQELLDEVDRKCPIDSEADFVKLGTNGVTNGAKSITVMSVKPRIRGITVEYFPNTETLSKIIFE